MAKKKASRHVIREMNKKPDTGKKSVRDMIGQINKRRKQHKKK